MIFPPGLVGDIVVCAPIIRQEAATQGKSLAAHWAHIIIHGILHLMGYDHVNEKDAETMEAKETAILKDLGFSDPYSLECLQSNGGVATSREKSGLTPNRHTGNQ